MSTNGSERWSFDVQERRQWQQSLHVTTWTITSGTPWHRSLSTASTREIRCDADAFVARPARLFLCRWMHVQRRKCRRYLVTPASRRGGGHTSGTDSNIGRHRIHLGAARSSVARHVGKRVKRGPTRRRLPFWEWGRRRRMGLPPLAWNKRLCSWVDRQMLYYQTGILKESRIELLDCTGLDFHKPRRHPSSSRSDDSQQNLLLLVWALPVI